MERYHGETGMKIFRAIILFYLILLFSNVLQAEMIDIDSEDIQKAIDAGNAQWALAFKTQDAKLLGSLFSENGAILALDGKGSMTVGPDAIQERMQPSMDAMGSTEVTIKTTGLWIDDGIAYERGEYAYSYTPLADPKPQNPSGKYIVLWKQDKNGKWKIYRDIGLPD